MAIFLFCVFIFTNALPIFPIYTKCFVLYFHMLILLFEPSTGKKRGQAFRRRLDSCARFRSARRLFREGLFESGKVIFALHMTLNGFFMFESNISRQQHLYIICIPISLLPYQWYVYCLYITCYLIFKYWYAFPQQLKTHTFCFDCTWIDLAVLKSVIRTLHSTSSSRFSIVFFFS